MNIKRMNAPVAENIKRIINQKGLKQCVIATRIDCTAQELTDMLNGRRVIKVNDIPKFKMALDVEIGELFVPVIEKAAV